MNNKSKWIKAIGVAATVIGVGVNLITDWVNEQKMDEKIQAKLKAGRKLTKEEEDYLKQTNPQLYQQYKRIRAMVNAMEEKLKNATSKEEANDIKAKLEAEGAKVTLK